MITCADYRRALLAEPQNPSPQMLEHAAGCEACAGYTERMLRFEGRLERALRVAAGPAADASAAFSGRPAAPRAGVARLRPARRRSRWLAAAATFLVAAGVTALWVVVPGRSLAAAVVDHMAEEPQAWTRTDVPVSWVRLDAVLVKAHVRLRPGAEMVSYANTCHFRGHDVPHLVVQTPGGPVTVMVLPQDSVMQSVHFDEQGYRGVIVPVPGHGSLAVLERGEAMDGKTLDAIAAQVRGAIDYLT